MLRVTSSPKDCTGWEPYRPTGHVVESTGHFFHQVAYSRYDITSKIFYTDNVSYFRNKKGISEIINNEFETNIKKKCHVIVRGF
jgi:hypothetical protein